jgi:hypothetical protein
LRSNFKNFFEGSGIRRIQGLLARIRRTQGLLARIRRTQGLLARIRRTTNSGALKNSREATFEASCVAILNIILI